MHFWYQNLNESGRNLFHFRGSVGRDYRKNWFKYEVASGPELIFKYTHGQCGDGDATSTLAIGLLFCTVYLTFSLPKSWYFKKRCIATWDNNREFYLIEGRQYGFYFYEWAFVWSWHSKVHESSSSDPWWMSQYIHLDELLLGKMECLEDSLHADCSNVKFLLDGKEFTMDEIKWVRRRRFRRFIPYSLWHHTYYSCEKKIEKPPMCAGKGENSWDCGDDGAFGCYGPWRHERPTWNNRDACARIAVDEYVESFKRDARKYGRGSGERGMHKDAKYEYIGIVREPVTAGSQDSRVEGGEK